MGDIKNITNVHRAVARYLAMGVPLEEVLSILGLGNLPRWKRIVRSPLFQSEVRRMEKQIEEKFIEEASVDPVLMELRRGALPAAKRLREEIDNVDDEYGGSARTRITAAKEVLSATGYLKEKEQVNAGVIFLELSKEKLAAVKAGTSVCEKPDHVRVIGE